MQKSESISQMLRWQKLCAELREVQDEESRENPYWWPWVMQTVLGVHIVMHNNNISLGLAQDDNDKLSGSVRYH